MIIFPPPNQSTIYLAAALATRAEANERYDRFLRQFPLIVGIVFSALSGVFWLGVWWVSATMQKLQAIDPVAAFGLSLPLPALVIGGCLTGLMAAGWLLAYATQKPLQSKEEGEGR